MFSNGPKAPQKQKPPPTNADGYPQKNWVIQTASSTPSTAGCLFDVGKLVLGMGLFFGVGLLLLGSVARFGPEIATQLGVVPNFTATTTALAAEYTYLQNRRATTSAQLATVQAQPALGGGPNVAATSTAAGQVAQQAQATSTAVASQLAQLTSERTAPPGDTYRAGIPINGTVTASNRDTKLLNLARVELRRDGRMRWYISLQNEAPSPWLLNFDYENTFLSDTEGNVYPLLADSISHVNNPPIFLQPGRTADHWLEFAGPSHKNYVFQVNIAHLASDENTPPPTFRNFQVDLLARDLRN